MFNRKLVITAFCCSLLSTSACAERPPAKLGVLERVNATHAQLLAVAGECAVGKCDRPTLDQAYIQSRVQKILVGVEDVEVLYRLAIVAAASAAPQTAGEERVDLVFDFAWTDAVNRIGASKDTARALAALEALTSTLRLDGSGSLIVRENMEKLRKRERQ